jgi:hypothetical protein
MTINDLNYLSRIYNTLLAIKTSGEDTILMGRSLESFKNFLMNASVEEEEKVENKEE